MGTDEARLLRFVPRRLAARIHARPRATAVGVIAFADVVGFSALADRLLEDKGAAGVDQLARILDATLRPIVDAIDSHGGEVVTFPGDAVVAIWLEGPGAPLDQQARLAAESALAGQRALASRSAIEGVRLSVRQAIAVGELELTRVGDAPAFAVVGGPALREAAELIARATPGVLLARRGSSLVGRPEADGAIRVDRVGDPRPLAQRVERAHAALGDLAAPAVALAHVDPQLRAWIEGAGDAGLAQLRTVTACFCRLVLRPDVEHEPQWLSHAAAIVQELLARHLGRLLEVVDDDRGLVLVGVFGLPGAGVSRPEAPALAALELRDALAARGVDAWIGVATGRVFFGELGGSVRRSIGLRGRVMNLAARMMMMGSGVRLDEPTHDAASTSVVGSGPKPTSLKGFARPVPVFTISDRSTRRPGRTLHGRRALRDELAAALTAPGLTVLLGSPGVGKTAVLAELVARAGSEGRAARSLAATPTSRAIAGGVLSPLLDADQAVARAGDRAPLLGPALGRVIPDNPSTAGLQGFMRAAAAAELLAELLDLRGCVLVIEDAQWLDDVSVRVVELLAPTIHVLTTVRSDGDALPAALKSWTGQATLHRLGPLDPDDIDALVRDELRLPSLPEGLLEWLGERGGGHPGFSLELLALLRRNGLLVVERGATQFFDHKAMAELPAPKSIEAAFASRIDKLGSEALTALRVASALAPSVDERAWAAGCETVGVRAEQQLPELERAGLLARNDEGLSFVSPLLAQVVHDQLVREHRRQIHRALAHWLQAEAEAEAAQHLQAAALAWHWGHAGEFARALAALEQAFVDAVRQGLPRAASRQARFALRLDVEARELGEAGMSDMQRGRWHYRVAQASRYFGDTDSAYEHLTRATEQLELRLPKTEAGWNRKLFAQLLRHLWAAIVPRRPRASEADALRATVLSMLSLAMYFRAQHPQALLATALGAVSYARRSAAPVRSSVAYSMVAIALCSLPRVAERYLAGGQAQAQALGDPSEALDAMIGRLMIDIAHCRWDDAQARLHELLPLLRASRAEHMRAVLLGMVACVDLCVGEFGRCREYARDMIEVAEQQGYLQARGWARNIQATAELYANNPARALEYATEAQAILDRRGEPDRLVARGIVAASLVRLERLDEALAITTELEQQLAREPATVATSFEAHAQPVEVWLVAHLARPTDGHLARAEVAFARLRKFARRFPLAEARVQTLAGALARARGRSGDESLRRGAALGRARGMPIEVALALRMLDPEDPELSAIEAKFTGGEVG